MSGRGPDLRPFPALRLCVKKLVDESRGCHSASIGVHPRPPLRLPPAFRRFSMRRGGAATLDGALGLWRRVGVVGAECPLVQPVGGGVDLFALDVDPLVGPQHRFLRGKE